MFQQLILFVKTNNINIKIKEFLLLLSVFAIICYNTL